MLLPFVVASTGCSGNQSALNAQGAPALYLAQLIWGIIGLCAIIWLLVMVVLLLGLLRKDRISSVSATASEQKLIRIVGAAVAGTAITIGALAIISFYTTSLISVPDASAINITVRGQQWWWQVYYFGENTSQTAFQTANEIHIPVGKDVKIQLESTDVIHSFWVPNLAGKQDLVPGRTNTLFLRAEAPGVFRGQCAEFCGLQHGHMALLVIAESDDDYGRWKAQQQADATAVMDGDASAGKLVFLAKPCAACHTVRGTDAKGSTGPDLTHVGSRQTIAAGLLDTNRGTLAAWIADPQTLKPGNNMPQVPLSGTDLRNVAAYMDSLK